MFRLPNIVYDQQKSFVAQHRRQLSADLLDLTNPTRLTQVKCIGPGKHRR